jgi:solute carrier family 35 protein C2
MTWEQILKYVAPIGIATATDVALSNTSLLYISLTLHTIIKSSVLAWTYIFGIILHIEELRYDLMFSVLCICIGISLAVTSSTDFNLLGVFLVLVASACGGLRWVLVQQLMGIDSHCSNPFASIYRFSPYSCLCMWILTLVSESKSIVTTTLFDDLTTIEIMITLALVSMGGFIAFALITTEVHLVHLTSSLTLGVMGQIKEITQICLAMLIFHDRLNHINISGIIIAMLGITYYKTIKYSNLRNNELIYSELKQVSYIYYLLLQINVMCYIVIYL